MNCDRMENLLARKILDVATPAESAQAEAHVRQCTRCRAYEEKLRAAFYALQNLAISRPPAFLADRVIQRAAQSRPAVNRFRPLWMPALFGAAALLLAGVMIPRTQEPATNLTAKEALAAYTQDYQELGFWQTGEEASSETTGDSFDAEQYGIPIAVSQLIF